MKICITDATYKHSLAIARYLKQYDPSLTLYGLSPYRPRFSHLYSKFYSRFIVGDLARLNDEIEHDLMIPVGNHAASTIASIPDHKAILPNPDNIALALDKLKTIRLAKELQIPVPRTIEDYDIKSLGRLDIEFPCVVKGIYEAGKKVIAYPRDRHELKQAVENIYADPSQKQTWPVIQEYVTGTGLGFFGFYQNGKLKRYYLHQRIREMPITGGASTSAQSIFHQEAFEFGKRILDHLSWHGVAMVEFKYDPQTQRLALMEINPKFWGSAELGLAAGINFGELLVRAKKGEDIPEELSPDSFKKMKFFWPTEGDWQSLYQSRNWKGFLEYLQGGYQTNFWDNGIFLSALRLVQTWKHNNIR